MLKYSDGIEEISKNGCTCPPPDAVEQTMNAFRWCNNPLSEQCFLPQAVKNPPRLLRAKSLKDSCSCWGLSMHTTLNGSQLAFQSLENTLRNARKIFGGYVAYGKLTKNQGLVTTPDRYGHFDLHEYKESMLYSSFSIDSEIPRP